MRTIFLLLMLCTFVNAAYNFDKSTPDYFKRSDPTYTDTMGTICVWMTPHDIGNLSYILASSDEATTSYFFGPYRLDGSGVISTYYDNGPVVADFILGSTVMKNNKLYLVVVSSNGSRYKIRVNCNTDSLTISGGANNGHWFGDTDNRDNLTFGVLERTSVMAAYDGIIHEIRIYDRELTDKECVTLYKSGIGSKFLSRSSNLVGWWDGRGTGTINNLADRSQNGFNLQKNGSPVFIDGPRNDRGGGRDFTYTKIPSVPPIFASAVRANVNIYDSTAFKIEYDSTSEDINFDTTDTWTMAGWFQPHSNYDRQVIFSHRDTTSSKRGYVLAYCADIEITGYVFGLGFAYLDDGAYKGPYFKIEDRTMQPESTYHFALTYNGTFADTYWWINGERMPDTIMYNNTLGTVTTTDDYGMLARYVSKQKTESMLHAAVTLQNFKIFGEVLDSASIDSDYAGTLTRVGLHHWPLDSNYVDSLVIGSQRDEWGNSLAYPVQVNNDTTKFPVGKESLY